MFAYQEASPYKKYFHWAVMPATDSGPPKIDWLYTYANADIVVPYTEWARSVLSQYCGDQINLFPKIANAGINATEFYPLPDKQARKEKYFGKDASVVGVVMRNQARKLFPDLMVAYRKYLNAIKHTHPELYNNSYLYLHTSYPEDSGWDLPSLLLEYGLLDRTYITYVCRKCNNFFPSKFNGSISSCPSCQTLTATVASPINGVKTNQLNEIYNLFDLFIQYAICEGFGMPQVEAAACGLQIASVDYSAMSEICDSVNGIKIPVQRMFRELGTNADRAYPDIDATVKIMVDYLTTTTEQDRLSQGRNIRDLCLQKYTWDHVYSVWEECFDSLDVRNKANWNSKDYHPVNHKQLKVPHGLNNTEFVRYICSEILNDPSLFDTANIQCLVKDLNFGLVPRNGAITTMTRQNAIELLEGYLNNKIVCDEMKNKIDIIKKEDFLL
jgi:glycosyltransferase involved in cell wall biosynthesis